MLVEGEPQLLPPYYPIFLNNVKQSYPNLLAELALSNFQLITEENSRTVNKLAIRLLFNSAPGLQPPQVLALEESTDLV
jgi:hypothetical protein